MGETQARPYCEGVIDGEGGLDRPVPSTQTEIPSTNTVPGDTDEYQRDL